MLKIVKGFLSIAAVLIVLLVNSVQAHADDQSIKVVDKNGDLLANAVLIVNDNDVAESAQMAPEQAIVDQVDRQFTPFMTVIKVGSDIVFPNSDNIRHNVYSFSEPKPFELKLYANEERPTLDFQNPGLVTLGCNIHDQMIAHIVVVDRQTAKVSNEQGQIMIGLNSDGAEPVNAVLWHPWLGSDLSQAVSVTLNVATTESPQVLQLNVVPPAPEKQPESRLQQRFNRTGNP